MDHIFMQVVWAVLGAVMLLVIASGVGIWYIGRRKDQAEADAALAAKFPEDRDFFADTKRVRTNPYTNQYLKLNSVADTKRVPTNPYKEDDGVVSGLLIGIAAANMFPSREDIVEPQQPEFVSGGGGDYAGGGGGSSWDSGSSDSGSSDSGSSDSGSDSSSSSLD